MTKHGSSSTIVSCVALVIALLGCLTRTSAPSATSAVQDAASQEDTPEVTLARSLHEQEVMTSRYCADCHPAIYAEHERSTHGRAFTDEEVRLATGRFDQGDCIICHTPRPIFETGIGMNPMRRHYGLDEGNTCMTCHWKKDYDYGGFAGGPECTTAFEPRVAEVEACASCHRNHGTPFQWATAEMGKKDGTTCVDCHMATTRRPVAVGEEPSLVRTHAFPGSRDEAHVRRAYSYKAEIIGNEVVVSVKNKGVGHNFPTELKQRSVESLIIVKDVEGREVARSRMVFRDPYKRPYGLHLPVNTQIPSGHTALHRVPIGVADGTVECELHFKLYYPIQDHHPDLARRLENRKLVFNAITPSQEPVLSAPEIEVTTPESIGVAAASPANLVDFARPPIGTVEVDIPEGDSPEDIEGLIDLFQFPVPAAAAEAGKRLVAIGAAAIPQLMVAIGSWDNKTWNKAMNALEKMGEPAIAPLIAALGSDELYVRVHARDLLVRLGVKESSALRLQLLSALEAESAIDRASAAGALGELGSAADAPALMRCLDDRDPDVVRAAALSLSRLQHKEALPAIAAAIPRFIYPETRRDLATAMARMGSRAGVSILIAGLDEADELLRESYFEAFFGVTGVHLGYDPLAPRPDRLNGISRIAAHWAARADRIPLRGWPEVDHRQQRELWVAVDKLANGGDDAPMRAMFIDAGSDGVPMLLKGLKFPAGFADRRAQVCELLGLACDPDAVPALIGTLRDPVVAVASWACWALEKIGDPEAVEGVQRFERRIHTLAAAGRLAASAGTRDGLLAQTARTRLALGEDSAQSDLVTFLLSEDAGARHTAINALQSFFGFGLGYQAEGSLEGRRTAAAEWVKALR